MIRFGTDGWRGVIARDYTFENLALVARVVADDLLATHAERSLAGQGPVVLVGYDRRFLSAEFAAHVAGILASAGLSVRLADAHSTTPAISVAVVEEKADLGLVVTASHNPREWNGLKIKNAAGGSAPPRDIERIQARLDALAATPDRGAAVAAAAMAAGRDVKVPRFSPARLHLDRLRRALDVGRIAASGLRILADSMYGAASGILETLFEGTRLEVDGFRSEWNPAFPGINPEPIEKHVGATRDRIRSGRYAAGFVFDGDGDRIGALTETGRFVDSHRLFALLLTHLYEDLGLRGRIVKTVSTTVLVDRLAARYGLPLTVTPIGFKHIADLICQGMGTPEPVLIGGEESGGIGLQGYIPERDGILCALYLLQMMTMRKKTLGALFDDLESEHGRYDYAREDLRLREETSAETLAAVRAFAPAEVAGFEVLDRSAPDGFKFSLAGDRWLLLRPSNTEPVLRVYAEGRADGEARALLQAAIQAIEPLRRQMST